MKFSKSGEFQRGRRFPLKTKGNFFRSCVRPAKLHGCDTWCLRENEIAILRREKYGESNVWGQIDGQEEHKVGFYRIRWI